MHILGLSAYFHDSAAALLRDGEVVAAVEEERFSRIKHDSGFPARAIDYVMESVSLSPDEIDAVVYYEKPFLKFDRLLENTFAFAPRGFSFFCDSFPTWMKDKLYLRQTLKAELKKLGFTRLNLKFSEHHLSHAASAFYPSPFSEAAILCLDGVGEWCTTSLWMGKGREIELLAEIDYPHSLGLFYSAFTAYCGFHVNSDEYKVMGLAPYGQDRYSDLLKKHFIDIKNDGSFRLNMKLFDFGRRSAMLNFEKTRELLGVEKRNAGDLLTQEHCDLAHSTQLVLEEVILKLADGLKRRTGAKYLCMAGGVALNCVANGLILENKIFDQVWVQPAAGDSGGALGAALAYHHLGLNRERKVEMVDAQKGSLLDPEFSRDEVKDALSRHGLRFREFHNKSELYETLALELDKGKIGGLFQGRMEFGPRALGARSILADPRLSDGRERVNKLIKFRENFRPFAPAILKAHLKTYFDLNQEAPYMQIVAKLKSDHRREEERLKKSKLWDKLSVDHTDLRSVVHVDYTARLQTLCSDRHESLTLATQAFYERTGCPVLLNTSFNVKGEPIVCTPDDGIRCFLSNALDFLAIDHFLVLKEGES